MGGKFDKYLGKFREKDSVEGGASGVQTVNGISPNDSGNVEIKARNISTGSGKNVEESIFAAMPAGTVIAYAGSTAPDGFIACNGAAVSRGAYASLFAAIGTLYGEGDGSTTFNLPDLTDRVVQGGATAGTALAAGLPNISGSFDLRKGSTNASSTIALGFNKSFYSSSSSTLSPTVAYSVTTVDAYTPQTANFDASRSNAIYGNSNTVQPPALTMIYCIKY